MALLKQSTAYTRMFLMVDSTDHFTGKTGLTVDVDISKAGGVFAAAGGTVTEIGAGGTGPAGWYKIALTTTDTNTIGDLAFHCTATGADPTDFVDQVRAVSIDDLVRSTTPANTLDVNATGEVDVATIISGAIAEGAFGTGAISARVMADAAIDRATFANDTGFVNLRAGTLASGAASSATLDAGAPTTTDLYKDSWLLITGGTGAAQSPRLITAYSAARVATVTPAWNVQPDATSTYAIIPAARVSAAESLTALGTGAISTATFAAGAINAAAIGADAITAAKIAAGAIDAGTFAAGAIDAGSIATDAITSAELASSAITEVAAAVWDELASSHVASGSFGQRMGIVRAATAQAGAATTITLDASASAVDDFYNNGIIFITGGTGAGQSRIISDYVGSTKVATVPAWVTNPTSSSIFVIMPFGSIPGASAPTAAEVADAVWDEATVGHTTGGTFGEQLKTDVDAILVDTVDIGAAGAGLTALPWNAAWDTQVQSEVEDALVVHRLDELLNADSDIDGAAPPTVGSVFHELLTKTTGSFTYDQTTDSLEAIRDASVSASTLVDLILDEDLSPAHDTAGTVGKALQDAGSVSAVDIADAVWDEALADHLDLGSTGEALSSADTNVGTILADTNDIQTRIPAALVSGRIDASVGAMAANVLTATAINADAITAAKVAADVTTEIQSGLATAAALATVQADTDNIQTRLPAALVSGRMDSSVGAMAANVITAAAAAADFGTEMADAVWDEALAGHAGVGSAGEALSAAGSGASAATIADAVWDAVMADHLDGGTTGASLNGAGSAGDPWTTAVPGAYGAGTAGKIVGDALATMIPQTGNAYTRLGAPAGASVSADIAAAKVDTAAILADTGTDGVVVASGSKAGYALSSAGDNAVADALLDRANAIETGLTPRGALRLAGSAEAGKLSGAGTSTITIRNAVADSKARITATVDASGNRTAITTDVT